MMPELDWYWWHSAWEKAPDAELAYPIHLEWYRPDAGLKIVGAAINQDRLLLYQR